MPDALGMLSHWHIYVVRRKFFELIGKILTKLIK
jgi:hypothetical protein